jgi:DNA-binding NarL/FixJ family response regulator
LRFIIEQDSDIQVIGCCKDGKEAFDFCGRSKPDLVLMDIMMPECNGIEGTKLIKAEYPDLKILVLTTFNDQENIAKALKYGADGYVLKDICAEDLVSAIKSAARGLAVIHRKTLDTITERLEGEDASEYDWKGKFATASLSEREIQLIQLIARGKSNKEIGQDLHLSEGSVKNMITKVLKALGLEDRVQLVVFAVKNGLV